MTPRVSTEVRLPAVLSMAREGRGEIAELQVAGEDRLGLCKQDLQESLLCPVHWFSGLKIP